MPSDYQQKRREKYPRDGEPWTHKEMTYLCNKFKVGASLHQHIAEHKRPPGGIASRLKKLGMILDVNDYLISQGFPPVNLDWDKNRAA
jgi:hypothetical protein